MKITRDIGQEANQPPPKRIRREESEESRERDRYEQDLKTLKDRMRAKSEEVLRPVQMAPAFHPTDWKEAQANLEARWDEIDRRRKAEEEAPPLYGRIMQAFLNGVFGRN